MICDECGNNIIAKGIPPKLEWWVSGPKGEETLCADCYSRLHKDPSKGVKEAIEKYPE